MLNGLTDQWITQISVGVITKESDSLHIVVYGTKVHFFFQKLKKSAEIASVVRRNEGFCFSFCILCISLPQ